MDCGILDPDGELIAETFGIVGKAADGSYIERPAEANAALIVRAVNSHAALLAACAAAREWLGSIQTGPGLQAAQDQLDRAIAKAKGRQP